MKFSKTLYICLLSKTTSDISELVCFSLHRKEKNGRLSKICEKRDNYIVCDPLAPDSVSNSGAVQVKANLQEQLGDHLHFRNLERC